VRRKALAAGFASSARPGVAGGLFLERFQVR